MAAPLPAYRVFSQRPEHALDLAACDAQARRFFDATLEPGPEGHVAVAVRGGIASARAVSARAATNDDHALADDAEARAGGGGLAGLARRCPTVWEVERRGDDDRDALLVAAILASLLLGPIVEPDARAIFGVRTARARLEALEAVAHGHV